MLQTPRYLLILALFFIFFHLGILHQVIQGLHLTQREVAIGLGAVILLGMVNIQLFVLHPTSSERTTTAPPASVPIAVNLGGCILPLGYILYLFQGREVALLPLVLLIGIASALAYLLTRVHRRRVVIYLVGAVAGSALGGLLFGGPHYLVWAYTAAVLGTLIGGDLLHLSLLIKRRAGQTGGVFIGGDGIMDAIFLSGLLAMLVAESLRPHLTG